MGRILLAFLLFMPFLAHGETGRVSTFELENGLQGVVIEDHRAPIVTHMVWYRVGSADEPPGHSGIAHFLEHLMFKGTERLGPGEFSRIVKENGGVDNAFTSFDYTAYFQRVARDRLPLMMELEADRMRNLRLDPAEVATERAVVLEERVTRTESDPGALFSEQRRAAQYLNHPYGRPIVGWRHEIEALDREDALAFYRRYYAPNNAILIVAGDVTPEEVQALAEATYGKLAPNPDLRPRARPQEPPQLSPRRLTFSDPRERRPYLIRTYLAPVRRPGDQREAAALTMLSYILGGTGITSLLGEKLQLERGLAVHTQAWYSATSLDPDGFGIYAQPRPGVSLAELEAAIDEVLADLVANGFDDAKLDRLKAQVRAEEVYERDDQEGLARTYGQALTAGLTVEDVREWPKLLQEVTEEEIVAAAKKVLDLRASVTALMEVPGWEGTQ